MVGIDAAGIYGYWVINACMDVMCSSLETAATSATEIAIITARLAEIAADFAESGVILNSFCGFEPPQRLIQAVLQRALLPDFDQRVEYVPSLREARSLTVEGDWTFSDPVTVVGDAVLADAGEPRVVDDEVIGRR